MGRRKKAKSKQQTAAPATKTAPRGPGGASAAAATRTLQVDWPGDEDGQSRLLTVLKYQTLGPFLFTQKTLCTEAEHCAVEGELLPLDEGVWPVFFEQSQWRSAVLVVQVVLTSSRLCETNQSFRDYLLKGSSAILKEGMVAGLLKMHSKPLSEYTSSEVLVMYKVLRLQVTTLGVVGVASPAHLFLQALQEKEQMVLPIKERGNANFKEGRYRAAIGDYTRAIQISPYSAVLYCNRALCYMKNSDTWSACVDSYRALVLRTEWEKPYYRCAESWLSLGNLSIALSVNVAGCDSCSMNTDLLRQRSEILAAMKAQGSVPHSSILTQGTPITAVVSGEIGKKERRKSSKARKRERRQREERAENSAPDHTHSVEGQQDEALEVEERELDEERVREEEEEEEEEEEARESAQEVEEEGEKVEEEEEEELHVVREKENDDKTSVQSGSSDSNHGDTTVPTEHQEEGVVPSDKEGSASDENAQSDGSEEAEEELNTKDHSEGPQREPIEDDNDWRHQHTSSVRKVPSAESVPLHDLKSMFNMERLPVPKERSPGWLLDMEAFHEQRGEGEAPETRSERETREMAAYKQRKKERDRLKSERQAMRTAEERKMSHTLPNPDPYNQFQALHVPTLDPDIATSQLFSLLREVPLRQLVPKQYMTHSEAWCSLEPLPTLNPLIRPKPPTTILSATFDEVWCPMLADVTETADIIPPRIHYVGNMVTKYIAHYPPHYRRYEL